MENLVVKKRGRKPLEKGQKVILVSVYLKQSEKDAIVAKYGSVTNAVREEVIPKISPEKLANL